MRENSADLRHCDGLPSALADQFARCRRTNGDGESPQAVGSRCRLPEVFAHGTTRFRGPGSNGFQDFKILRRFAGLDEGEFVEHVGHRSQIVAAGLAPTTERWRPPAKAAGQASEFRHNSRWQAIRFHRPPRRSHTLHARSLCLKCPHLGQHTVRASFPQSRRDPERPTITPLAR